MRRRRASPLHLAGTGRTKYRSHFPLNVLRDKTHNNDKLWFWSRMPFGESQFDVCRRVAEFFGSVFRCAASEGATDFIIVTHGCTVRAIRMMWLRQTPGEHAHAHAHMHARIIG